MTIAFITFIPNSRQTQKADAGIYKCQAKNKFGTESASGSLVVKEQTRILSGPKGIYIYGCLQLIPFYKVT